MKLLYLCLLCLVLLKDVAHGQDVIDVPPEEFIINMDIPPQQRWRPVLAKFDNFKSHLQTLTDYLLAQLPEDDPTLVPFLKTLLEDADNYFPGVYAEEMKGIAGFYDVSVADVVLLNILYEWDIYCSGIIAQDSTGQLWHGRNIDYTFADIFRNITFIATVQKRGCEIYKGLGFVGMVGFFTGQRPFGFSLSVNARTKSPGGWFQERTYWKNVFMAVLDRKAVLATLLVREVLEQKNTYQSAVSMLKDTHKIAPAYYIIAGTKPGEGTVISSSWRQADDIWALDVDNGRWFLVQTNTDHWQSDPDGRSTQAIADMEAIGQGNVNGDKIYEVLSKSPVLQYTPLPGGLAYVTISTTIMSAGQNDSFCTMIRYY